MARGWESKSVEGQIEAAREKQSPGAEGRMNDEEKKAQRERVGLALVRTNLLRQLEAATNERYKESLRQAVSDLDRKIAALEKRS